jgi:hypothetical protein
VVCLCQPWIAVSGDGAQRAFIMKPLSASPTDWTYSLEELINVENTVGGISAGLFFVRVLSTHCSAWGTATLTRVTGRRRREWRWLYGAVRAKL